MTSARRRARVIFALIAMVAAMLAVSAGGWAFLSNAYGDAAAASEKSESLLRLRANLTDLETAARGYALTEDDAYLEPVAPALAQMGRARSVLQSHLNWRDAHRVSFGALEALVERRVAVADAVVDSVSRGEPAAALAIIRSGEGKRLHDLIRQRSQDLGESMALEGAAAAQRVRLGIFLTLAVMISLGAGCVAVLIFGWRAAVAAESLAYAHRIALEQQARVVEDSPDLFVTAHKGRVEYVNRPGREMLGVDDKALIGRPLRDLFPSGSPFVRDHLPALEAEPGVTPILNDEVIGPDGRRFECGVRGFSVSDERGLIVTVACRDLSDFARLNAQLEKSQRLESLGKLTGGVAHDFNNLLTVITGCAEATADILKARGGDPELESINALVEQAADQGASLTRHLLAFARRQPLSPRRTDLHRLLKRAEPLLRRTLGEDIALNTITDGKLSDVLIDPGQMENVLLNLCLNARHAMPQGGHLTLEAEQVVLDRDYVHWNDDVVPGPYVRLAVTDDGCGMSAAVLARAFEPFFSTRAQAEGSGLGLSMVYGFLKQSNGHVKIYSEVGQGTTVNLYLPCAPSSEPAAAPEAEADLTGGSEHVLIVEDDALVRGHVVRQLTRLGYQVEEAESGAEALERIQARTFDLLFTDVVMPGGMNGRQLAEAARLVQPQLRVLYTSGYTENAIVHQGRLDRGVQLLQKPYRRADLAAAVRNALGNE
jgi:PAS domain S-box-containing protein